MTTWKNASSVLVDRAIYDIQLALEVITWLTNSFGRAIIIESGEDTGRSAIDTIVKPIAYNGDGQYVDLLPTDKLGCFSFMVAKDPAEIDDTGFAATQDIDLYLFGDSRELEFAFPAVENAKQEVIRVLRDTSLIRHHIDIRYIYDDVAEVWRGLGATYYNHQFVMYPYFSLRFRFSVKYRMAC